MHNQPNLPHVLVVDDDPLNAQLLVWILCRAGFAASSASDGEIALRRLRGQPFAAVITDVHMPRMSGLELLQAIRRFSPCLPVIVMTAMPEDHIYRAAFEWRALAVYSKPVDRNRLVLALREVCREPDPLHHLQFSTSSPLLALENPNCSLQ